MPYNQDMIGNATDAALALSYADTRSFEHVFASGANRLVFLINGVIYKVGRDETGYANNDEEYEYIRDYWHNLPTGVFFPKTDRFILTDRFGIDRPVIAMAYVTGQKVAECYCLDGEECDEQCIGEDISRLVAPHMHETAGFNVIVTDTAVFIVDPC